MNTPKTTSLNIIVTNVTENSTELNFNDFPSKKVALEAFKLYTMKKIDEITDYKDIQDMAHITNFFSLMTLEEPSDYLMPAIRTSLAFVEDDANASVQQILDQMTWGEGGYYNLKFLSSLENRIMQSLINISENPEKFLSKYKLDLIKDYLGRTEEAFGKKFW